MCISIDFLMSGPWHPHPRPSRRLHILRELAKATVDDHISVSHTTVPSRDSWSAGRFFHVLGLIRTHHSRYSSRSHAVAHVGRVGMGGSVVGVEASLHSSQACTSALLRWATMGERRDSGGVEILCHMVLFSAEGCAVEPSHGTRCLVGEGTSAAGAIIAVVGTVAVACNRFFVVTLGKVLKAP